MRRLSVCALAVLGCMFVTANASAEILEFNFALDGSQVVPPNNSNAAGAAQLLLVDTDTQQFSIDLLVFGIGLDELAETGPNGTAVHIHSGAAGETGPIVVDLGFLSNFAVDGPGIRLSITDALFGGTQGALTSDPATNIEDLLAGNLYVQVHTDDFPGGQIRGQIVPEPALLSMMAIGGLVLVRRKR
jgi:CHRD domain